MQISVETEGALGKVLKVEVPEEKVSGEVENRLKTLSRTTRIQGFRTGKAPFKLIKSRFGPQVRDEVVGEIVRSSFQEAIEKEKLRPAATPRIDKISAETGKGITYTASFEILPEITLAPIEGLIIDKISVTVEEADIDRTIETLRRQRRTLKNADRKSTAGDVLTIDFRGAVDGAEFEGGTRNDFTVDLATRRLISGFEDGLLDRNAGDEFVLDLKFPEEYHIADLAGKPVQFAVTIKRVEEPILPEIDAAFLTALGIPDGSIEELRRQVREHMEAESKQAVTRKTRESVMEALFKANRFEIPGSLVAREIHQLQHQFEDGLKARGLAGDQFPEMKNESFFDAEARKRVTLQLVVGEIIRTNDLKADPARVRAIIEGTASGYQDPAAFINWYYSDPERHAEVEVIALEEAVVDWVAAKAGSREVKLTFDELTKKGQTETGRSL
jgi:trigger factor